MDMLSSPRLAKSLKDAERAESMNRVWEEEQTDRTVSMKRDALCRATTRQAECGRKLQPYWNI